MADGINSLMREFGIDKSPIREVMETTMSLKQQGYTDFWDFSIGNPEVPTPPEINESIREILDVYNSVDLHGYTPTDGWEATRRAIADDLNDRFDANADASDLILTAGAAGALTSSIAALTTPGEEVIVLTPYFPEYRLYIQAWSCRCVPVPTIAGTFQIDVDAVRDAIGPRTRMVIVNTPNNPTGAIYSEASLRALGDMLRAEGKRLDKTIYLLSDEPYREIVYDGAKNPWVCGCYENTIMCYSYSKSLSLAGERVGYVYVPKAVHRHDEVLEALHGAQRAVNTITGSLIQRVIERCVKARVPIEEYAARREIIYNGLTEIGYDVVKPEGAFYLWLRALEPDDAAFAERATKERIYMVYSGDFGCPGYERLSYSSVSRERLAESLSAFQNLWDSYGGYTW